MKLNPGDIKCDKCGGSGLSYHDYICKHCGGEGKLDWIEQVVGVREKTNLNKMNQNNLMSNYYKNQQEELNNFRFNIK